MRRERKEKKKEKELKAGDINNARTYKKQEATIYVYSFLIVEESLFERNEVT